MLQEICDFVHNYFILETKAGEFQISNGTMTVDGLKNGQRFRIKGSALNDGIFTYTEAGILDDDCDEAVQLSDETFTGTVDLMGVPRALLQLCGEIKAWTEANGAALNSPFTSESFGGYSYSKPSGSGANGSGSGAYTWRDQFRSRLNTYRKLA